MNGETLSPYYQPYQPYDPTAGMPGGGLGSMAGQYLTGIAKNYGYMPIGYNYGGDLYNLIQRQDQERRYGEAMARATAIDASVNARTAQGGASFFGFENNPARESTFGRMMNSVMGWVPPEMRSSRLADTLSGGHGLGPLTGRVADAGRSAIDPVTGEKGYSSDTAFEISQGLHNRFFGSRSSRMDTHGLSPADMGDLFGELSNRGMMPASTSSSSGGDPKRIRSDLTKRIGDQLKDYSGAIAAVRDLFGNPDSPIPVLMAQLEQLTGNSMQQLGGARSANVVRNMMNYAQAANVGVEGLTYMAQYAGDLANRRGLNSAFMPDITVAGLAMRDYMNTSGSLANPAWGLASIEQQGRMGQQRMAGAIGSKMSNRAGLLKRLEERGVLKGEAADIARKMDLGVIDDSLRTMNDGAFADWVAKASGLDRGTINSMLTQNTMNSEFVNKYGIAETVMNVGQRADMADKLLGGNPASLMSGRAQAMVKAALGKGHGALGRTIARAATSAMMNMSESDLTSDDTRYGGMAKAMYDALAGTTEGEAYLKTLGSNPTEQMAALGMQASDLWGSAERQYQRATRNSGASLINPLLQMRPKTPEEMARAKARVQSQGMLQSALSGAYDPNAVRRVIAEIQSEGGKDGAGAGLRALSSILGVEKAEEIQSLLLPKLQEMQDMYDRAMEDKELSPEERDQLEIKKQALNEQRNRVMDMLKGSGVDLDAGKGDAVSPTASSSPDGGAGGAGPIAMNGTITININGNPVATGDKGSITMSGTSRGAAPNAGAVV